MVVMDYKVPKPKREKIIISEDDLEKIEKTNYSTVWVWFFIGWIIGSALFYLIKYITK